ncbi:CRISPR-associated endonuclease/helicase Cas3/CRISPR-associated protein Cas5t [Sinosporangium album]|uniref:CRISPR-associated endonuclease/helicase Cas3/CRISPR-associated protein Cas5t n=1 Tax=Sinosporangium album TaxID=504805 RepID=A0A1G7VRP8_9ACTN|nr:CRISPR-associated protein Cas5 [Sinosporangium album]SDG62492.1 CRISPR-associated endonuclease/helicase Cas3/CRISPR-associated protein Cas5t [Sinosporangium album]
MSGHLALEITVAAPIASFRNPLYSGVQVALPCPPPSTVGGMLAAAAGDWEAVDPGLRFAMAFHARGLGSDLETYHPLEHTGKKADPTPRERQFLADVTLTVWLTDDISLWERRMRRPVWPLRLGRSQDLAAATTRRVTLRDSPGIQRRALLPETAPGRGTLLRLPTAISLDRGRTRWYGYRFDTSGQSDVRIVGERTTEDGQAVVMLPPVHPSGA